MIYKGIFKKMLIFLFIITFVAINVEVILNNDKENVSVSELDIIVSTSLAKALQTSGEDADCSDLTNSDCNDDQNTKCNTSGDLSNDNCMIQCDDGVVIWCKKSDDPIDDPIEN
jgi:hypothetical protein